jgi:type I restriction enzyme S subunit
MVISLGARHDFLRRYGIPDRWRAKTLGDLAQVVGGGTPSRDESRFWIGGKIAWATPTDLTANHAKYIAKTAECITEAGLASSAATLLPAGTVLYTSRATIGAKAVAALPMTTNQGFASFLPRTVDGEYLYYLLDLLTPVIKRLGAGTTFDEVSKRDIRTVWCAVPSDRDEQAAIARILDTVDAALERTRAAVERAREVKRALVQRVFVEGLRGERTKKTPIGHVPRSWQVVPVHSIVTTCQYGLSVPMELKGELPILRMGNIQDGDVLLSDIKFVSLPAKIVAPYRLRRGDVLFNRTNSQEWVGKVGIYRHDTPAVFASYLIRLLPDPTKVDNYYLGHVLGSYPSQCRIKRYATPGVQQVNINATNLGKVLIPLPVGDEGLREQRDIAAMLEAADAVVRNYEPVLLAQQTLKKSLMHDLLTGRVRVTKAIEAAAS